MDVVTVVPDRDQPEPGDGGEHRRPRADDYPHPAAGDGEEAAVPLGGTQIRRQGHVALWADGGVEGRRDPGDVPRVRDDDEPPLPRGQDGVRGRRKLIRPRRPGQGIPDRAGRPAGRERGKKAGTVWVALPPAGLVGAMWRRLVVRCVVRRRRGVGHGFAFDPRMPRRNGQAHDIGERARVPVRDRPRQGGHLGQQDGLRTDGRGQRQQRPLVVGRGQPVEDVAADKPAVEAHPHPRADDGRCRHLRRDQIVERSIEVRGGDVDADPGDGPGR